MPHIFKSILRRMRENQFWNRLPYSTQSIGSIGKHAKDACYSTKSATIALVTEHCTEWTECHWVGVEYSKFGGKRKSCFYPSSKFHKFLNRESLHSRVHGNTTLKRLNKVELDGTCPELFGKANYLLDLVPVPLHNSHNNLRPEPGFYQVSDTFKDSIKRSLHTSNPFVSISISAIKTHRYKGVFTCTFQGNSKLWSTENTVCLHRKMNLFGTDHFQKFENCRMHQRLTASQLNPFKP